MNAFWTLWAAVAACLAIVVHVCVLGLDGASTVSRYLARWLRLLAALLGALLGSLVLRACGLALVPFVVLGVVLGLAIACLGWSALPLLRRRWQGRRLG